MAYFSLTSPNYMTHKRESRHTSQWVSRSFHNKCDEMPSDDISTSHVAEFNESCCRDQRVMLHIATSLCAMSHVAHINESCCRYQRVMLHIATSLRAMSHVADINESCCAYERVTWQRKMPRDHIPTSHVAHIHESCRTYQRVMSHIKTNHMAHIKCASDMMT